jgi:hypothetical protein
MKFDNIALESLTADVTKDFTLKLIDFDLSYEAINCTIESLKKNS